MDNGLFGIYQSRDIYFTLDMLRILSPRSTRTKIIESDKNEELEIEEEKKES
jgi:hypothetical protein